jgi:predicted DNA-binding WGR domain protein
MKKYFEYTGPSSENKSGEASKFWEVTVEGSDINIRYGKIGVNGSSRAGREANQGKDQKGLRREVGFGFGMEASSRVPILCS